jgi:hypothetical protein
MEGENGVTRDLIFGNNTYADGYIIPLDYATSATRLDNTIQVPSIMTVAEILNYLATDQIGTPRPTVGNVTYGAIEIAEITPPPIDNVKFTIWATEHKNIDPVSRNYRIPIYIKSDENTSETKIEKLVIEVDRNIFYPRRIEPNTVEMSRNFIDSIIEMTFENITVPALSANEPKILFTVRGDIILGKDSSEIKIDTVIFSETSTFIDYTTENGFITVKVCEEGGDRFLTLTIFDYSPSISVKNITVTEMLEVHCKTIERGSYSLEIVDLQGSSITVHTWTVAGGSRIFDFEIDVSNLASGSYFVVMNTPTNKYSARFVKQ